MNLSIPGDNPYSEDEDFAIDYEIVEIKTHHKKAVFGLPFCDGCAHICALLKCNFLHRGVRSLCAAEDSLDLEEISFSSDGAQKWVIQIGGLHRRPF